MPSNTWRRMFFFFLFCGCVCMLFFVFDLCGYMWFISFFLCFFPFLGFAMHLFGDVLYLIIWISFFLHCFFFSRPLKKIQIGFAVGGCHEDTQSVEVFCNSRTWKQKSRMFFWLQHGRTVFEKKQTKGEGPKGVCYFIYVKCEWSTNYNFSVMFFFFRVCS